MTKPKARSTRSFVLRNFSLIRISGFVIRISSSPRPLRRRRFPRRRGGRIQLRPQLRDGVDARLASELRIEFQLVPRELLELRDGLLDDERVARVEAIDQEIRLRAQLRRGLGREREIRAEERVDAA